MLLFRKGGRSGHLLVFLGLKCSHKETDSIEKHLLILQMDGNANKKGSHLEGQKRTPNNIIATVDTAKETYFLTFELVCEKKVSIWITAFLF